MHARPDGSPAATALAAPPDPAPVLVAERLHKEYPGGAGPLKVLRGVDLEVGVGETLAIVGASGAGKSTLLHLLGGLDRPTHGEVVLGGQYLSRLSDAELSEVRSHRLGFVFQFHHLLMEFSAVENVAMPLRIQGVVEEEAEDRAREILEEVGLGERLDHRPSALSGGEQQRVAVARALVHEPVVVLADEPSGNLDRANSERLHDLLFDLAERRGVAFVVATHDEPLARRADRLSVIEDGELSPLEAGAFHGTSIRPGARRGDRRDEPEDDLNDDDAGTVFNSGEPHSTGETGA